MARTADSDDRQADDGGDFDLDVLLSSPLDEPPGGESRAWLWVTASVVILVTAVVFLLMGRSDHDESAAVETEAPTSTAVASTSAVVRPGFHIFEALAFDPVDDALVMFGGQDDLVGWPIPGTWIFDLDTRQWRIGLSVVQPWARVGHGMVYVDSLASVVVFGGGDRYSLMCRAGYCPRTLLSDMWSYDVADDSWTELLPTTGTPGPRYGFSMTYDSESDRIVLFGGAGEPGDRALEPTDFLGDTWIYDPSVNQWTPVDTPVSPPASAFGEMIYDPVNDLSYLWGGLASDSTGLDQMWTFDADTLTWTQVEIPATDLSPAGKWMYTMSLDAASHTLVVLGGNQRATTSSESGTSTLVAPTGEVWLFDLGSNRWRQAISVGGPLAGNSAVATSIGPVSWVGVQLYQFDDTTEHWTELESDIEFEDD